MKIVFSNYDDIKNPFYGGGGAYAIHSVAKRLAGKHDVTVITHAFPGSKNQKIDGVFYRRIGSAGLGARRGQLLFKLILPFYALGLDCDIWVESFIPPFSLGVLPLLTRKKVVGLTHLLPGIAMEKKYHLPFSILERIGLGKYHYFITLTEYLKTKIKNSNHLADIRVIPNGIEKTPVKTLNNSSGRYVLYLGRIDIHQKGLDTLLKSYSRIKDSNPLKLIIAGSGKKSEILALHKLILEYKLSGIVEYVGFVSGGKKSALLQNCAFTVLPSRFESFGISVLESFHFKKGVVVSDIEELGWIPKKASVRFRTDSEQRLADVLVRLMKDKKYQLLIGREGYKTIDTSFNWDIISARFEDFFDSILRGPSK